VKLAQRVQLVRADRVAQQRERLPDLAFRRYVANMWTEREGFWLPEGAGQRCIGEPKFTPGEDLFLGSAADLDLAAPTAWSGASSTEITAFGRSPGPPDIEPSDRGSDL
jgi:hypothetical protein